MGPTISKQGEPITNYNMRMVVEGASRSFVSVSYPNGEISFPDDLTLEEAKEAIALLIKAMFKDKTFIVRD